MPDVQNSLLHPDLLLPASEAGNTNSVRLFTRKFKSIWVLITLLTCISSLVRMAPMSLFLFDLCYAAKVVLFFLVGFLAPLAFSRLNGLGLGLVFSFVSAFLIEVLQGTLRNGHAFHWHELAGKLVLIVLGFAIALNRRYEQRLGVGVFCLKLQTTRFE